MTDKQKIIDGVDVSGCVHSFKDCCTVNGFADCKASPNCYYKQLKRKEQECERLKKKLNPKLKNAHCAYFEGQTGLCKAKEFTKCNPVNCKLYTIDELSTIVDLQQQLDQFKAELHHKTEYIQEQRDIINHYSKEIEMYKKCQGKRASKREEELKAEKEELSTINARLLGRLEVDETDTSLVFNLDKELRQKEKEFYTAIQKVVKLKQALTEIKEIAEHCIKQDICTICDYNDKCHIEDEEIPTYDVCKLILQKISEVIDGK